jgi:hypothetical protein
MPISSINIVILCSTIVIITNFHFEHGSCLFEVRYNITCSPKGKDPNFHLLTRLNNRFSDFPNMPTEAIFWPLLRYLTISGVLGLHFKRGWSRQKAKTRAYKSHEGRRTQFCPEDTLHYSSTNQTYCLIGFVMTSLDWRPITGVL